MIKFNPNFKVYLFAAIFFCSCETEQEKKTYTDTATSGEINIAADESFSQITSTELDTFLSLYKNAKINVSYLPESEAFLSLVNDSVRCIIAAREVNENEINYFKTRNLIPRITHIATDAIAFIVNQENKDTLFSVEELSKIISGETNTWNKLGDKKTSEPIQVIFDNQKSSTARYLKERFLKDKLSARLISVVDRPSLVSSEAAGSGFLISTCQEVCGAVSSSCWCMFGCGVGCFGDCGYRCG